MRLKDLAKLLTEKLSSEHFVLPGVSSQVKLSPVGRQSLIKFAKVDYYPCGVMIFLFEDEQQEIKLVLFQRQIHDGSAHSGQISFPGGKFEETDIDYIHTGIRETYEEIGVMVTRECIIGELTSLKIPVSGFELFPIIGYSLKQPTFQIETGEVDHLIFVSLNELIHSDIKEKEFTNPRKNKMIAPYFEIQGYKIWGATAMILSEFRDLVNQTITFNNS